MANKLITLANLTEYTSKIQSRLTSIDIDTFSTVSYTSANGIRCVGTDNALVNDSTSAIFNITLPIIAGNSSISMYVSSGKLRIQGVHLINTTYSNLVNLKKTSSLLVGMYYRITDYQTTTSQTDTQSAGHQFDIVVQSTSSNTLSEDASAISHSGDSYFTNSHLNAWKLKYSLTNDTTRFAWASSSGKGVIYEMEDEWGNKASYDFKNIQFKRYAISGGDNSILMLDIWKYWATTSYTPSGFTKDSTDYVWCYTFHNGANSTDASLTNVLGEDYNGRVGVYNNIIKPHKVLVSIDNSSMYGELSLNNIVMYYLSEPK